MNRRAFTLLELLLVMAIMGFMGTLAVGGYRAMRRGMEERAVMENVNKFVRSAYERAQIDLQPVNVYCWNETLRDENGGETMIVVGHAVAVRQSGRLTRVTGKELFDEFGDLRYGRNTTGTGQQSQADRTSSGDARKAPGVYFYPFGEKATSGTKVLRSTVSGEPVETNLSFPPLLQSEATPKSQKDFCYYIQDQGDVEWKVGMAYGFEFADIQLPHNYIFGSGFSKSAKQPVGGGTALHFFPKVALGSGTQAGVNGSGSVAVYSLRPSSTGELSAMQVGTSERPDKE